MKKLVAIQEFIYKNKNIFIISIIFTISIVMLIVSGWLFCYQKSNENSIKTKDLLEQYQRIVSTVQASQFKKNLPKRSLKDINAFINKNINIYGFMASMVLTKYYVNNNELDKAVLSLKTSLKSTKDINLITLINLRLARIQIEQKKFDEALKTIGYIKNKDWIIIAADIRGEALFGKGEKKLAKYEWNKVIKSSIFPVYNQIINMKINS
ncbi:YfgM family protein [Candidatus Pantoea edessiphila]|nr:tetratricopeptide repeat protein [Candidatus Pantoea edessiphila]